MNCELCGTDRQGDETRCSKCGFDTTLPSDVKRFLISLTDFRPGELLDGRYRIDRVLGFGGMSVVYKAHDEILGEEVAIKVINGGRGADDAKLFTDIRRDIVTTRKLAHPDIVKVHDFHKASSCGFLTMEFVQGQDLATLIAERGRLEEGDVCRMAIQVAEALNYAHANGVVHCDIKPGNLLLTKTGRVKIADFGISRVMQEENTGLTGLVVGTPAYMSPEQIRGERPTPLTDMYALGIVMWHCLMGKLPYTRGDIAYQHVHVPLPPLEGVNPELERIVCKAAAKVMVERFPSLDVMARELQQLLRRQAEATIMQTPPPRPAETIMQTPPPRVAETIMWTPPPQPVVPSPPSPPADPILQPPPIQQETILAQPPPPPASTVMQTPPPRLAAPGMGTLPPQNAATIAQAPAAQPEHVPAAAAGRETLAGAPPAAGKPAGGETAGSGPMGETPPPGNATGGAAHATSAPPPAPAKSRMAAVAAVAVVLAAAVAWGLFSRGTDSDPVPSPPTTGPGMSGTAVGGKDSPPAGAPSTAPAPSAQRGAAAAPAGGARPVPPPPAGRQPATATPASQSASAPQPTSPVVVNPSPAVACKKPACFEILDPVLTPSTARPGQTVRCTARYTFSHNERGATILEVEESAQPKIRFSRGESRRIMARPGTNQFAVSFTVPDRLSAGTYPVTLSVRRRSITESVKLPLIVTK